MTSPIPSPTAPSCLKLHPLLSYSQFIDQNGNCCPIIWDLREEPQSTARPSSSPSRSFNVIADGDLCQKATYPSRPSLSIHLEILPEPWSLKVNNANGVTIYDILSTIHTTLQTRITHPEWDRICTKQREKITRIFSDRCRASIDREGTTQAGVLRVDCLLRFTLFSGLSLVHRDSERDNSDDDGNGEDQADVAGARYRHHHHHHERRTSDLLDEPFAVLTLKQPH